MASSSGMAGPANDMTALKESLYLACVSTADDDPKLVFHQDTLKSFGIIPNNDINILLPVIQALVNDKLLKAVHDGTGGIGWRLRTEDEAKKFKSLTAEQEMVYGLIDEAEHEGIWTKTIKAKLKIHDTVMNKAIKHLESKNMIAEMKSVEHPTRKMWIKASLRPSERATGGPWYTDGELDEEFISQCMSVIYAHVKKKSFYVSASAMRKPKKMINGKHMTSEQAKAARDKVLGKEEQERNNVKAEKMRRYEAHFPMPVGYNDYPGLDEITQYVDRNEFTNQILTASEIQQLLDIMCYDDILEKVLGVGDGVGYRALRRTLLDEEDRGSVLSEAPCGRCPVFDLCEEGGPVGPSNCEYLTQWLKE
ncbi:RNA polymerase Rpc34 [Tricladium varicosporioides]|nr:RNA polymerase Rpc34 [Hymenoscyphus varicosporioides]